MCDYQCVKLSSLTGTYFETNLCLGPVIIRFDWQSPWEAVSRNEVIGFVRASGKLTLEKAEKNTAEDCSSL